MKTIGARFSLYPMTDDFISDILGALERTDTSAVYSVTDAISTVYRGSPESVIDAIRGLFVNAYREGVHMAIEGDIYDRAPEGAEIPDRIIQEPNALVMNSFPVKCRLTLTAPTADSEKGLDYIANVFGDVDILYGELSFERIPYGAKFEGDVIQMFSFLSLLLERGAKVHPGLTVHFTRNCNSPTAE